MGQKAIKLCILQMNSKIGDIKANHKKVQDIVERELPSGVDFLVLPEVWTVGWSCEDFPASAEPFEDSPTLEFLSKLAKAYDVNILGGSFIQKMPEGKALNSCPVFDRHGRLAAIYSKNHLYSYCGCSEGNFVRVGDCPVLVTLEGIKIGLTICYDIRFPEIFRAYRIAGADLIVNMAAWGSKKPVPWETLTRARAIENQIYLAAVTQSGPIKDGEWNIGHSRIFDYMGETIAEIKDQREGICSCDINFNEMYKYRNTCTILKDIRDNYEVTSV